MLILLLAALGLPAASFSRSDDNTFAGLLRQELTTAAQDRGVSFQDWPRLQQFYVSRNYQPVWFGDNAPLPRALLLLSTLRAASTEGLDPNEYGVPDIEHDWYTRSATTRARLELQLTDAFFRYGQHVRSGRLDPLAVDPDWHLDPPELNPVQLLLQALTRDRFGDALQQLPPPQSGYRRLREALARYREMLAAGGWVPLPAGPALRAGVRHEHVPLLRHRLVAEGELRRGTPSDALVFDGQVAQAVKRFQARYGLPVTGTVDSRTRNAMNVPAADRVRQITLNMERWRWLPRKLGQRYVMVNTADFRLTVVENDKVVLAMPVITGTPDNATPVLGGSLRAVEFNPYWTVPAEIAIEELVPKQLRNKRFFESQGIRVYRKRAGQTEEVMPDDIDWSTLNKNHFPYVLRQEPGPLNALGRVKFHFANSFAIYLHDTPKRHLFLQSTRAFSHGCIRVQQPVRLATYLLAKKSGWNELRVRDAIIEDKNHTVSLSAPVPIYLGYFTAWVNRDGTTHFRPDIYQRDKRLAECGPDVEQGS